LFVRGHRRGHALPRVAVAVHHAHAEFGERAEERHLLGHDLSRRQKGDAGGAVALLNGAHAPHEHAERALPRDRLLLTARVAQERNDRAIGRGQRRQRFPALGARHAEVDRIAPRRRQVHRAPLTQVHRQRAARRAVAAHHVGGGVGSEARRHAAEAEAPRLEGQLARQRPLVRAQQLLEERARLDHAGPPGIFGAVAAAKKSQRSHSSPASTSTKLAIGSPRPSPPTLPSTPPKPTNAGSTTPPRIPQPKRATVTPTRSPRIKIAARLSAVCRRSPRWRNSPASYASLSAAPAHNARASSGDGFANITVATPSTNAVA